MTEPQSSWAFVGISPEARQAAELAAEAAGMELDTWLAQLIKYKSAMELKGREAMPLDAAILQIASPGNGGAARAEPDAASEPRAAEPEDETAPEAQADADTAPEAGAAPVAEPESLTDLDREADLDPEADPKPEASAEPEPAAEPTADDDMEAAVAEATTAAPEAAEAAPPAPEAAAPVPPPAETAEAVAVEPEPEPVAEPEAEPEPVEEPEAGPSPRKTLPTEALRPSRLSALNQASEDAIQGAFDAWRDSRTLEPLLVRPREDERNVFEVIVGVERWHAARRAHIRELPVIVHHASDEEAIRLAMSARLKRGPLSPLTEAGIYLSLMSEASMTTEQVARMVGKPPAHVATMVRVLNLPRAVRDMLERGELTALHARALLDAPNAEALAREVIARRLDIYQTEQLVRTATLRTERAEKVDLDAVDLDLGGGTAPEPAAPEPAVMDGDIGFGPEERFDREAVAAPRVAAAQAPGGVADDSPPFDEPDANLVFDDVTDDSLDLIDAPEMTEIEPAPPAFRMPEPADTPEAPEAPAAETSAAEAPAPTAAEAKKAPPLPEPKKGVVTTELLEHHLSHLLGLKVSISEHHNMGVISIHYTTREDLSDVVSRLNSGSPG